MGEGGGEREGITTHRAVNKKTTLSLYTSKVREAMSRCLTGGREGDERGKRWGDGKGMREGKKWRDRRGSIHQGKGERLEGREVYYLKECEGKMGDYSLGRGGGGGGGERRRRILMETDFLLHYLYNLPLFLLLLLLHLKYNISGDLNIYDKYKNNSFLKIPL